MSNEAKEIDYDARRAAELAEEAKQQAALDATMKEVAKLVGMKFKSDTNEVSFRHFARMVADDGMEITAEANGYGNKGRIVFSGYNKGLNVNVDKITVSVDKSPQAIASDLQRRFIPKWKEAVAEARKVKAAEVAHHEKEMAGVKAVAKAFGTTAPGDNRTSVYALGVSMQVTGDRIRIEHLYLPVAAVEEFAKLIKKYDKA